MIAIRLTKEIIEAAILGFESQKEQIDRTIAELRTMRSGDGATEPAVVPTSTKAKRKMSAAAIERIREGQRRRWANARGTTQTATTAKKGSKSKRRLSPAGRKAIVDALKRRWAAKKAA